MKRLASLTALTLAVVLSSGLEVYAQPGGGRPEGGRPGGGFRPGGGPPMMMGGMGGSPMMLLMSEQVRKEIKLTEDQETKLRELGENRRERMRGMFAELRDKSPEERMEAFRTAMAAIQEDVNEILTDEQQNRLGQISMQMRGERALLGGDMADKLKLSDSQKEKLEKIFEDERAEMRELGEDARGGDITRDEARKLGEAIRAETKKKVNDILTDAQTKQLSELRGEPFEMDRRQLFQRPEGGRRGPGGRGDGRRGEGRDGERGGDRDGERRRPEAEGEV